MTQYVNSADSHVVEPLSLWLDRLPPHLRERAPRLEEVDGVWRFLVEGMPPRRMGNPAADEERDGEKRATGFRPGGSDPDRRAQDLDEDGVWGEVLYPTIALFGFMIPDPELRWASARTYNDWLVETFTAASKRFAGAAMVPVQEIDSAVEEIERVAQLGLRSIMLPMQAPEGAPYNLDRYDPIWAAAQAHAMPVSFHVGTGSSPWTERGPGGAVVNYVEVGLGAQRTLGYLAASGVLERFPELHVVMVECGAGWLSWLLERMDEAFEEHASWVKPKLAEPPSFYVRRQGHVTFGNDAAGVVNREFTGVDSLLWASDYPHPEGTWPHTQETLTRIFTGVDESERRRITYETTAELYGLQGLWVAVAGSGSCDAGRQSRRRRVTDLYLGTELPLPTVDRTNAGFWRAAAEGRLDVQCCGECGAHRQPPTEGCYRCGSLDWHWATLPGTGTVFTYTWVTQPLHPGVESRVPYNVSVVEVDGTNGDPVRLVTNVVDASEESLRVGATVRLACERLTDDVGLPRFRLA